MNSFSDSEIGTIHHILTSTRAYETMTDGEIFQMIQSGRKPQQASSSGREINDEGIIFKSYGGRVVKFGSTYKFTSKISEITVVYSKSNQTISISMSYFNKSIVRSHQTSLNSVFRIPNGTIPKMITSLSGYSSSSVSILLSNGNAYVFAPLEEIRGDELVLIDSNRDKGSYYGVFDPIIQIYTENRYVEMKNRKDFLFYVTDQDFILLSTIKFYDGRRGLCTTPLAGNFMPDILYKNFTGLRDISSEFYERVKELIERYFQQIELNN